MNKLLSSVLLASLGFLAPLLVSSTARADGDGVTGLEACGNINVSASATCNVEVSGGCTAHCTPISFEAACSAKGYASCSGECNGDIEASCDLEGCQASCEGGCAANPDFNCSASCSASLDADCSGKCSGEAEGSEARGKCEASCKATAKGECDASCNGSPVTCTPVSCEASCKGKCKAKANFDCQASCQAKLEVNCEASLKGGCEAQCSKPEGALYCDGQYVDAGNNLADCEAALKAALNIQVHSEASCSGNSCQAEADASCGSRMVGNTMPVGPAGIVLGGAALGLILARRRRNG